MKGLFKLLVISVFLALILTPVLVSAVPDEGSGTKAPIAQPLVREGTLAMKLVGALNLGKPANEAEAEATLVSAGIAPKNGWMGDYPVTPDIVGELQVSVNEAATAGRLTMTQADASKAFQDVIAGYNLAVSAGPAPEATADASAPAYPDTTVVNNYYYDEGPPIVTYYAPPADYWYLYSWVPYPFWGWGFWFPGFFVLADFDVDHHGHHHHDGDHDFDHDGHFSNHFRDPHGGSFSRIDPANRTNGGTLIDRARWSSTSIQRNAASIINRSATMGRSTSMTPSSVDRSRGVLPGVRGSSSLSGTRKYSGGSQSNDSTMPSAGSRSSGQPGYSRTPSVGSRFFNQPSYSRTPSVGSRSFSQPGFSRAPSMGRSFSAPSISRSGGFSGGRSSFGSGGFGGRGSSGGSFGGGRR